MKYLLLISLLLLPLWATDTVEIGKLKVDAKERSILIPAKINQDGEIAEFLLVHKNGKVHEALWSTEVTAVELAAAIALFGIETEKANKVEVPKKVENVGALPKVEILVSNDQETWFPATSFVKYKGTKEEEEHPWHYYGSYFWQDKFMAQVEGDLIAIYTNVNALILMEHPDRTDDTLWLSKDRKSVV